MKKLICWCVVMFSFALFSMESDVFVQQVESTQSKDKQEDLQQDGDDFVVYLLNLFGAPLNVDYVVRGHELRDRVEHKQYHELTEFKELAQDSQLKISRAGAIKQYLAASVKFLRNKISQLKTQASQEDAIFVIHCYSTNWMPVSQIRYDFFCVNRLKPKRKKGSPFFHFPTIEQHGLEKKITYLQVMQLQDSNEILCGYTAKDIARYILGLDQQFNGQDIQQKSGKLYAKWRQFERTQSGLQDTHILQTFDLIEKAKQLLIQTIQENKDQSSLN